MEYTDTAPRFGRGRDRSGTSEASTADSPTATVGSRAAQIKIRTIPENVIFLMILWPKM